MTQKWTYINLLESIFYVISISKHRTKQFKMQFTTNEVILTLPTWTKQSLTIHLCVS